MKRYRMFVMYCFLFAGILWNLVQMSPNLYAAEEVQSENSFLSTNVCPEGQYLDLSANTCRNLAKGFGFKADEFAQNHGSKEITLASCSQAALVDALDSLKGGGGTVKIPACTINVSQGIYIPSGVLLEGAGIDKTKLQATSGFGGNLLQIKTVEHVIVRDLSVDGGGSVGTGIMTWYAHNVMVERVDVGNADGAGMRFRYSRNFTVRYSASHNSKQFHGIGTKDCFPGSSKPDDQECAESAGNVSPGALWTNNYAIYSNRFYKNGEYGLDSHSSDGEVAGNIMEDNRYGTKFPDASNLWIHHNRIANNRDWGSHLYATVEIAARAPRNVVFYKNNISGNGSYPIMMRSPVNNVYLIDNSYASNNPNSLLVKDVTAYTCSGTADAGMSINGGPLKTASAQQCDLGAVAHIFGQDSDAPVPVDPEVPPGTIPEPLPQPDPDPNPDTPPVTDAPVVMQIPGRIEAEDFKQGGEGTGYHDTTPDNQGGEYRNEGVDIEETSDSSGKYNTGWTSRGEWLAYDVEVAVAGQYIFKARVGSWDKGVEKSLSVEVDGAKATGPMNFSVSDKDNGWVTVSSQPVQIAAGKHEIKVVMDADYFRLNYIEVEAVSEQTPPTEETPTEPTPDPESGSPTDTPPAATGGTLYGKVALEGRPQAPNSRWATDLVVRVYDPGQAEPRFFHTLTSSEDGQFQIDGLPGGNYQVTVESLTSLRQAASVQISGERTDVDFGQLVEGDAFNDNAINVLDFSSVARGFGACSDDSRFVLTADFNQDSCIDGADLSLLKKNFGLQGHSAIEGPENSAPTVQRIGEIHNRQTGEQFVVPVVINNIDDLVIDSAAFYMNFNPSELRVVNVAPGTQLEMVLEYEIDNDLGQINFAAGTLNGGTALPLTLMTVTFEAKTELRGSGLSLEISPTRMSEIAFQGQSIFNNVALTNDGAISLETAAPQMLFLPIINH